MANQIIYVYVEGIIGVGKSTFLNKLKEKKYFTLGTDLYRTIVETEPIAEWCVGPHNLLDLFYKDPQQYAFLFQVHAFRSRVKQLRTILARPFKENVIVFMERGLDSDLLFGKLQKQLRHMSDVQYHAYYWQYLEAEQELQELMGAAAMKYHIYLHAPVELCMARVHQRNREEETGKVSLFYQSKLQQLHDENFLNNAQTFVCDVSKNIREDTVFDSIIDAIKTFLIKKI
jgi:deoxyadenosine/deoxycytidine kinase